MKRHIPIMVSEILEFVPENAQLVVDGTFGHAGHTIEILKKLGGLYTRQSELICFERDPRVIENGKKNLGDAFEQELKKNNEKDFPGQDLSTVKQLRIINDSYTNIKQYIENKKIDFVLLDLGINREHVTDNSRGFSIQGDGPLDMRFTPEAGKTAFDLIGSSSQDQIKDRFLQFADFSEKRAGLISTLLYKNRKNPKLNSTFGLIEILKEIRIHRKELAPLFQAIRIATNKEFENIDAFISSLDRILAKNGRCAIMTFHSIEDRIIKYAFKSLATTGRYKLLNKHVVAPHYTEVQKNRASRSAKLRVIEKIV